MNKKDFTKWTRKEFESLPTSGLLRIFCDKKIYVGSSLSSFEIYFKED